MIFGEEGNGRAGKLVARRVDTVWNGAYEKSRSAGRSVHVVVLRAVLLLGLNAGRWVLLLHLLGGCGHLSRIRHRELVETGVLPRLNRSHLLGNSWLIVLLSRDGRRVRSCLRVGSDSSSGLLVGNAVGSRTLLSSSGSVGVRGRDLRLRRSEVGVSERVGSRDAHGRFELEHPFQ